MQRQYRLCQNRQFSYVYRRGKRASCRDLTILYIRNRQKRVGFSVSKKVGCAVVRNRVKRLLRECFRHRMQGLPAGLYVVVARPTAAGKTLLQLSTSVDGLLQRLQAESKKADRP